jgi:hypothetical protein
MFYKENWDDSKKRLSALWENEIIDRCCMAIPVPKYKNGNKPNSQISLTTQEELERFYINADCVLERNIASFENTIFMGEALPSIFPFFGTGGHAAYFGSKVTYAPDTIWFTPIIEDFGKTDLQYDPDNEFLKAENRFMAKLANKGKGKFFIGMPDNCGSLDALAQLRGSNRLLMDLVDQPEVVKAALDKVVNALIASGDEQFALIKECCDGGSCHSWMNTWSSGKHMQLQCDFSVMISPDMYEEFVIPELIKTSEWLDHSIYHLDGQQQIRHLDHILSVPKINMIQWTRVAGQPLTSTFIPVFKKIQQAGKGLVLFPEISEVETLLSELSPKGLYLNIRDAQSTDEAEELLKMAVKYAKN